VNKNAEERRIPCKKIELVSSLHISRDNVRRAEIWDCSKAERRTYAKRMEAVRKDRLLRTHIYIEEEVELKVTVALNRIITGGGIIR
jgi:hypothetical protein